MSLRHASADVADGVRLHYVTAGTGPLVVLIHGFPEFWFSFRHAGDYCATGGPPSQDCAQCLDDLWIKNECIAACRSEACRAGLACLAACDH